MSILKFNSAISEKIIYVLVGAIFPLGFAPINIWIMTAISAALLIYWIVIACNTNQSHSELNLKNEFRNTILSISFYWSLGAYGVGVSWVYVSIHEFGNAVLPLAVLITALFIFVLSLIKLSFGYLIYKLLSFSSKNMLVLIIPFAWVVSEFIVSTILNGFPWLLIGYSQIDGPLSSLATWFGVYGVGWFEVIVLTLIVSVLIDFFKLKKSIDSVDPDYQQKLRNKLKNNILIFLIIISLPLLSIIIKPDIDGNTINKKLDVALVQPKISQEKKWDRGYFNEIINTLYEQSNDHWNADLIVWPEGAIPAYQHQVTDILADIERRLAPTNSNLLTGVPIYDKEQKVSYVGFIALGTTNQTYHKQALVPFGEYVPLSFMLRGLIDFFDLPMSNFIPGKPEQPAIAFDNYDVIPAICYEIAYPKILQTMLVNADQKNSKPKLIVTVSNDAWFGDSLGPYQHMQMARMRALELGIPLVRSTNDGITAIVNSKGDVINQVDRHLQTTLRDSVSLLGYKTIYRKHGFLGLFLIMGVSLGLFLIAYLSKRGVKVSKS